MVRLPDKSSTPQPVGSVPSKIRPSPVIRYSAEDADLVKLEAALTHPDTESAKARHTVLEPVEVYVEVEGGR